MTYKHPSSSPGLLCGALIADGAGSHDEDDPAGADVGAEGHLHPGVVPQRRGPDTGQDERGGGVLHPGRQTLHRQDCSGQYPCRRKGGKENEEEA